MKTKLFFISFLSVFSFVLGFGQNPKNPVTAPVPKKINVEHADFFEMNQEQLPDAVLLTGNVKMNHEGVVMTCNKAYFFQKENYVKAFGNVQLVQGDTLYLNSKYAEYNGNVKKAMATGQPVMTSPDATLVTDTIHFDRNKQEVYYNNNGVITNRENTLKSKSGVYYVAPKKFQFQSAVTITNPTYEIKSNHLDHYSNSGHSYLFGPSTITSKSNFIYTEKGFYDTRKNKGHFLNKSYIKYNDRLIKGDSLYYDRTKEFASATRNVKITDSINRGYVKGHYAEYYKKKDSVFVTRRAYAANFVENDSVFIHGKKLLITGPEGNRIIRAFNNVRFFKTDMSGKCDSIHSSSKAALTKLIGSPVIWNQENQITGDIMYLIGNNKSQKLDSLKVLNNAFMISKDTVGTGYNQVKGVNLFGRLIENKLKEVDVVKNAEVIYYLRNDQKELIGINKNVCRKINLKIENNTAETITFEEQVEGEIFPEKDLPENARKLKGFVWRGDERIKSKEDIFPPEENKWETENKKQEKKDKNQKNLPLKVRKETLNYGKTNKKVKK